MNRTRLLLLLNAALLLGVLGGQLVRADNVPANITFENTLRNSHVQKAAPNGVATEYWGMTAGYDGTTWRPIKTNASGEVITAPSVGSPAVKGCGAGNGGSVISTQNAGASTQAPAAGPIAGRAEVCVVNHSSTAGEDVWCGYATPAVAATNTIKVLAFGGIQCFDGAQSVYCIPAAGTPQYAVQECK